MLPSMPVTPRKKRREESARANVIIVGKRDIGLETAMQRVEGRKEKVRNKRRRKTKKKGKTRKKGRRAKRRR